MTLRIERDVPLAPLTTLGIGGAAKRFARATSVEELREALALDEKILVLGGGSNLVVGDAGWDGLAVQIAIGGVHVEGARVTVGAGVVWDDFVAQMVAAGHSGVECLSGIPGFVGATPIQNVGAYGQDVAQTLTCVRALDRERGELVELAPGECAFGYRTSKFKHSARWIVTEVAFDLPRDPRSQPIRYAELQRALGVAEGDRAPLADVRRMVLALRGAKGMVVDARDPDSKSAGSFFTNPIVDAAALGRLPAPYPHWPEPGGRTKLSAAWLIERAGFAKGTARGRVGISTKHALALVNRGGATAAELLALAHEIQRAVHAQFGIDLVPEPVIV